MNYPRATLPLFLLFALVVNSCTLGIELTEATLAPKIQSTKIYASDGSLVTTLRQEENREVIVIADIPQHVLDAVVAVEDERFYTHKGFDARAIGRALYNNAQEGEVTEGGSTITQQLVRNSVESIGKEQTLKRKVREAAFAARVDASFSKEKILELYMNTVYFGEGAYGIQTASQTFFGKNATDLSLPEGALLAGLIKAPVTYDPFTDADLALNRRNFVLDRMFVNELLDETQTAEAKGAPLGLAEQVQSTQTPYPYFIDYVIRLIQQDPYAQFADYGDTLADRTNWLYRGGLRIHTTLDRNMQEAAEDAYVKVLDQPDEDPSAGFAAVQPSTGHVKALVGGRDFYAKVEDDPCARFGAINADGSPKTCAKVNLALGDKGGGTGRQPGSAFKPFALSVALESGVRLTDVYSAPSCIGIPKADGGRTWRVCNYESTSFGSAVTVAEGTTKSINTVYAQLLVDAGKGNPHRAARQIVDLAKKMGIESDLEPPVPSVAIGTKSVSPLEMAVAYSVFPNGGEYVQPLAITKITDAQGNTLWRPKQKREQVLSPPIAYLVTGVLEDVVSFGTGRRYGRIGRPAFGKTGTSQEYRDAWWVGGAGTDLVAAVGMFWPDGEISMKASCSGRSTQYQVIDGIVKTPECRPTRRTVVGGSWPAQIWQLFMLNALEGIPASDFPVPEYSTVTVSIDSSQGCRPNDFTPKELIKKRSFIKGTEPKEVCVEPTSPVLAEIPSVVGFPEAEAVARLEGAGFVVEKDTEFSISYPPGVVVRQEPAPGSEAQSGAKISIWISVGGVKVPDVINDSEEEAKAALLAKGFKVKVTREGGCSANDKDCFVWDQDPDAGTQVEQGGQVNIFVKPNPDP